MRAPFAPDIRSLIQARLDQEHGTLGLEADTPVVLAYPSPYRVGMSSLGFQTLYRLLNEQGPGCHRAFLPDAWEPMALPWPQPKQPILSYEQRRPLSDYGIIGLSVAYELEIVGVIRLLQGAGIPLFARDRGPRDPIVIGGGPLTTSNASVLLPYVDVLIAGDGEELLPRAIDRMLALRSRDARLAAVEDLPNTTLGEIYEGRICMLPRPASAPKELLPAYSAILTPNTELADMFLVEPERGCSRQCTFCVMRGPSTGGMRLLADDRPLGLIPDNARRVGLVGAAVTDHPALERLVDAIVSTGRGVGISSLRADRLTPGLVANLGRGGYRQITVASDGISERMRKLLLRKISTASLRQAAELVRAEPTMRGLKVYQMIGAPDEDESDVAELIEFAKELASIVRLTMTFSTFVAKRNTPLDGRAFIGVKSAEQRLRKIREGLAGTAEIRPQSPRWAHVEYLLAQRGIEAGYAALAAVMDGARYRDWLRAFERFPADPRPLVFGDEERVARRMAREQARQMPKLTVL